MRGGVDESSRLGLMEKFVKAVNVVVVPVRGDDHLHAGSDIDIQGAQIVQRRGPAGSAIPAGIHDEPISVSKMDDDTFAEAGAED